MKICSICKEKKQNIDFWKDKHRKNGLYPSCKKCNNIKRNSKEKKNIMKLWYENNKEILLKKNKEYRKNNSEKIKKYRKKYWKENKKQLLIKRREYERTLDRSYKQTERRAQRRNIIFNINKKNFEKLIYNKKCYLCGDYYEHIGLDRVNNNDGYEYGKILYCCGKCNGMKLDHNLKDFYNHICKIKKQLDNIYY